jgi:hypothetical protein
MIHVRVHEIKEVSSTGSDAYASVWINDPNRENALGKATTLIEAYGWSVADVVEDYPISREDYANKPEGLDYYEQAVIDGEVAVFFIPK